MDAAGKGGAIKRLVAPLDPREYQIYNISAPKSVWLQHPYLWRFWTKNLPNEQTDRNSRIAIFDRTWYGRVLVERIEGFPLMKNGTVLTMKSIALRRIYAAGTIVIKITGWLSIKKNSLNVLRHVRRHRYKQFKLTDDDSVTVINGRIMCSLRLICCTYRYRAHTVVRHRDQ